MIACQKIFTRLKPGSQHSGKNSHTHNRRLGTWAIFLCLSRHLSRELYRKQSTRYLNLHSDIDATKRLNLQCHNTGPFITLKKKKSLEASCVVTLQQTIFRTAKWLHISDVVEYLVANVFHEDRTLYNKLFGRQCGR